VAEEQCFALSPMAKHMMSKLVEEGFVAGMHKEMFHVTSELGSVQTPNYWYLPTAPKSAFHKLKALGKFIFNGINAHVLNLLKDTSFQQEAFPKTVDYDRWVNVIWDSTDVHGTCHDKHPLQ